MKHGKNYIESKKLIDSTKQYDVREGLEAVLESAKAKFDETIEVSVRLGVDSRHADQQVRGAIVLPHGTGKTVRVLVFAKADKAREAQEAGADFVGDEDMVKKIQTENWFGFDVCVATPDMMGIVGRIGRVLGPKGLMPNQHHPLPDRQEVLRRRQARREPQHPDGCNHQGEAGSGEGHVPEERRGFLHDGPGRQVQYAEVLKLNSERDRKSRSFFVAHTYTDMVYCNLRTTGGQQYVEILGTTL